jgi:hypothetical protein
MSGWRAVVNCEKATINLGLITVGKMYDFPNTAIAVAARHPDAWQILPVGKG